MALRQLRGLVLPARQIRNELLLQADVDFELPQAPL